jgi:hypothetical protein
VTVERDTIRCDRHHALPVELITPHIPGFVTPAGVRRYALRSGWVLVGDGDFCPKCLETLRKPPAPEGWRNR